MKLAAAILYLYGALILATGFANFLKGGGGGLLLVAGLFSALLLALASKTSRGVFGAGYAGGVAVFLGSIYFAHRLVVTERLIPNGVLLVISFLALFGLILGVFLGLQRSSR